MKETNEIHILSSVDQSGSLLAQLKERKERGGAIQSSDRHDKHKP